MKPRFALKAATSNAHEALDTRLSTLRLEHAGDYRRFLMIQARVIPPLEAALTRGGLGNMVDGWAEGRRTDALRDDLRQLGDDLPAPMDIPAFASEAAMLGAAYVLEGSRLGAKILVRSVGPGMPNRFLAPGPVDSWPAVVAALDRFLYSDERLAEAADAASACFDRFIAAAHEVGL